MASLTVRISNTSHKLLQELAARSGQTMQAVLDEALEAYRRQCFLEGLVADFAALRADPDAWAEEEDERAVWDAALLDDLTDDAPANGKAQPRRPRKKS